MSRTPLCIGVALLALAALTVGAAAAVAPADTGGTASAIPGERPTNVGEISNTTNYLFPDTGVERRSYTTANVDVGSAVDASATRLESQFRARTLTERLTSQSAESGNRLAVAEAALADAQDRMAALDARQEALFRGYSNGSLSRDQFVRRLAAIEAHATAHGDYLDSLERDTIRYVDGTPSNFDTRLSMMRAQTVVLPDQMTERVHDALTGTADPFVLYAEGVEDTLVLGTVDGGQFHRQATLRDAYRLEEENTLTIEGALQRARELYPWVYSGGQGFRPGIDRTGPGLYRLSADHPQGSLLSYLSGSTADVFHETQTLDPTEIPVYGTVTNGTDGLNLSVTTTTPTGPMRVELTTPGGVPVNGTVLVNGQRVAATGGDGTLWTVRPSGTFRLTAVGESGTTVSLSRVRFVRAS